MSLISVPQARGTIAIWVDLASDPPQVTCRNQSMTCRRLDPANARGLEVAIREVLASFPPERRFFTPWYRVYFTGCDAFRSRFGPSSVSQVRKAARAAGAASAEESPTPFGEVVTRILAAIGILATAGISFWVLSSLAKWAAA